MKGRIALAGAAFAGLLAAWCCARDPHAMPDGVGAEVARPATIALAAAHGWHVAELEAGRHPPERRGWPATSTAIVLTGPTTAWVRGYCCGGRPCEDPIEAREAIELWLTPDAGRDGDAASPQAYRVPVSIYAGRTLRIYG